MLVRGCCVGVCENPLARGRAVAGLVFCDHFVRFARRFGTKESSCAFMCAQRSEEVEEDIAEKGRFFEIGVCREERREERVFHRFRAAVSAESIDSI